MTKTFSESKEVWQIFLKLVIKTSKCGVVVIVNFEQVDQVTLFSGLKFKSFFWWYNSMQRHINDIVTK